MKPTLPYFLFVLVLLTVSPRLHAQDNVLKAPFDWRTERLELPLPFAPSIPITGFEDVRFAPGWGDSTSTEFWTYAFVWVLEEEMEIDQTSLTQYLEDYYDGLMLAVAQTKDTQTEVKLTAIESGYRGVVQTLDGFFTKERIRLSLTVQSEGNTWLFLVSPQPTSHPVWEMLEAIEVQN